MWFLVKNTVNKPKHRSRGLKIIANVWEKDSKKSLCVLSLQLAHDVNRRDLGSFAPSSRNASARLIQGLPLEAKALAGRAACPPFEVFKSEDVCTGRMAGTKAGNASF